MFAGILGAMIAFVILMLISKNKKASVSMVDDDSLEKICLRTIKHPYLVHSDLVELVSQSKFKIELIEVDKTNIKIILSTDVTAINYGYFYSVNIYLNDNNTTEVEIRRKSKVSTSKLVVSSEYKKLCQLLESKLNNIDNNEMFNNILSEARNRVYNAMKEKYTHETGELKVAISYLTPVIQKMFTDNGYFIFSDEAKNIVCEAIVSGKFATEEEVMQA